MLCLNVQMQSIHLSKEIVNENDTIRVSITTLPDGQKQAKTIEFKEMNKIQPTFKVQMKDATEKIIIVFRKQNLFSDNHIIASTVLNSKDIHIYKELINSEHKKIQIFEPIQSKDKAKFNPNKERRVVGEMEVEFTLEEDFSKSYNNNNDATKCNNGKKQNKYSKVDSLMWNQEMGNQNFLFVDEIPN